MYINQINPFNNKIGIALSGGAARGIAHIGVLNTLVKANFKIEYLSGTSVGAIVASCFAFQIEDEKIYDLIELLRFKKLMSFRINKIGLMDTKFLEDWIHKNIGKRNIEDAPIPLAICATDIISGSSHYFMKGPLTKALCASSAIPGIVTPVKIHETYYVDGGISNNIPVDILKKMGAGIVLAVDLSSTKKYKIPKNIFDIVSNSIDIAIDVKSKIELKKAHLAIRLDLSSFNRTDNYAYKKNLLEIGEKAVTAALPRLKLLVRFKIVYLCLSFIRDLIPFRIPRILKRLYYQHEQQSQNTNSSIQA